MSGEDAELLAERLDPADRGKVDLQAFIVWLTSGFDAIQVDERRGWKELPVGRVFPPTRVF